MNIINEEKNLKRDKIQHKYTVKEVVLIMIGILLVASAIHFFLVPSNLTSGGASGIAIVLSHYIPLGVGPLFILVNIVLFIMGFIFIGKDFGTKTIIVTLVLSGLVWLFEIIFPNPKPLSDDLFLVITLGMIIQGIGVGMVLNQYTSTGGTDIVAKILQKFLGLDLGIGCLMADLVVSFFAGSAFGMNIFLYSVMGVIINGAVVSITISGLNTSKLCYINTKEVELVSKFIIEDLDRSANLIPYKGAYTKNDNVLIQTAVSTREYIRLKEFVNDADPAAFVVTSSANEILGEKWRRFI